MKQAIRTKLRQTVREAVAARLLSPYAVPSSAAVGAALLWFVLGIIFPTVLGIAWLVVEKLKPFVRRSDTQAPNPVRTWRPLDPAHPHTPLPPDSVAPPCEAG